MLNIHLTRKLQSFRWLVIASLIVAILLTPSMTLAASAGGRGGQSAPTANDDAAITPQGMPVAIDILANDTDPDDRSPIKPRATLIVVDPAHGSLQANRQDQVVIYTPDSDFVGIDTFVYTAADTKHNVSNEATVTITVEAVPAGTDPLAPVAGDDEVYTQQGTAVVFDMLANDSAPDPRARLKPRSIMLINEPLFGSVDYDKREKIFFYIPAPDFVGTDSFVYTIEDSKGRLSNEATVTVMVEGTTLPDPANQPPVAIDDAAVANENAPVLVAVLNNDSDPDGELVPASVSLVSVPVNGVADIDPATGAITYKPKDQFVGNDTLEYSVADDAGATADAQVAITVEAVNALPAVRPDLAETDEGVPVVIDVLANDSDSDGTLDPTSVTIVVSPHDGIAAADPATGAVTYTPAAGFSGEDVLTYTVADNEGAVSGLAQVTLTVYALSTPDEFPVAALRVSADGIYRVTYEALLAAGLDFQGAPGTDFALTSQGNPVPLRVIGSANFGPGSAIEFVGQALDTLYTDTNVYLLSIDATQAQRVVQDGAAPSGTTASSYLATAIYDVNTGYAASSPLSDPWYAEYMQVNTIAKSWSYTLDVDDLAAGPSSLTIAMYGITWMPPGPDHHVVASLNGTPVMDSLSYSNGDATTTVNVPDGVVKQGDNTLTLTLPADTGMPFEVTAFESATLTYPRIFVATDGALNFSASADSFHISGLDAASAVAYSIDGSSVSYLSGSIAAGDALSIPGSSSQVAYYIADASGLQTPVIAAARPDTDITSGSIDYLIIAHPDFVSGIQPLADARTAQGYRVRIVDVQDVYAQFSGEVFDPQAIKGYISYAVNTMGTDYVLLVGGDTTDYHQDVYPGAVSYIPSLYTPTPFAEARYAPADGLYADIDNDLAPEVALGRFPVRSTAELDTLVQKTLAYPATPARTAVFAADRVDTVSWTYFNTGSNLFASRLGTGWTIQKAYLDDLTLGNARATLIGAINSGVALTSYYGHASYSTWNYEGLFNSADARALTNAGHPTVVTSFGCWTNDYTKPDVSNALYQVMLFYGDSGAAAYMGSPALSSANNERDLGQRLYIELGKPGMSIGQALMNAKTSLAASRPWETDMLFHWTILGDPALVVIPAS